MTNRIMTAIIYSSLLAPGIAGAVELRAGLYRYDGGAGQYGFLDSQHVICDGCSRPPIQPIAPPPLSAGCGEDVPPQTVIEVPESCGEKEEKSEPITKGAVSESLATVYFRFNEAVLREKEKQRIREVLLKHPEPVAVRITGHACRIGAHAYNMRLSQKRAEAVAVYLRLLGIRVVGVEGLGDSRPLGGPLERDRRTEILISKRSF